MASTDPRDELPETVRLERLDCATPGSGAAIEHLLVANWFGEFELLAEIGRGADSVVYRARQVSPPREVALKVLSPVYGGRFELETEALARLDHPGVAKIHSCGSLQVHGLAVPYIVMELVDGKPLHRFADAHRLDAWARVALLVQVAEAVEYAHRRGVIHRDLKPANVLVSGDAQAPQVRVLDFGLARVLQSVSMPWHHTTAGAILGTPGYMSPEQAAGSNDIDTRADVHALGAMLYEQLAGHRAVPGDRLDMATLMRIQCEEPPPLTDAPESLQLVVSKAMQKDRERRYGSAGEFAADLRRAQRGEPVLAGADRRGYVLASLVRLHWPHLVLAAVVVLAIAVGAAGVGYGWACERDASQRLVGMASRQLASERDGLASVAWRVPAAQTLESMLPELEQFAECTPSVETLSTLALATRELGDVYRDRGDWLRCCELRQRGVELRERLRELCPDDAGVEVEWAVENVLIADALKELGEAAKAKELYLEMHWVFAKHAGRAANERRFVDELGWSIDRRMQIALDHADEPEFKIMLALRKANVEQLELLAPNHPATEQARLSLIRFDAVSASLRGEVDKQLLLLRWSYDGALNLVTQQVTVGHVRAFLAAAPAYARVLLRRGKLDEARAVTQQASALIRSLQRSDPQDEPTLCACIELGCVEIDLLLRTGQLPKASEQAPELVRQARRFGLLRPGHKADLLIEAITRQADVWEARKEPVRAEACRAEIRDIRAELVLHDSTPISELLAAFHELRRSPDAASNRRLVPLIDAVLRRCPDNSGVWRDAAEVALWRDEPFVGLCYLAEGRRRAPGMSESERARFDELHRELELRLARSSVGGKQFR